MGCRGVGEREPLERLMHIAHAANERVLADGPQLLAQGAARHGKAVAGENDMGRELCTLAVARQGNDGDGPALRVVRKDDDGAVWRCWRRSVQDSGLSV